MIASLGCAVKYSEASELATINTQYGTSYTSMSGVKIASTLKNEGILPYQENSAVIGQDQEEGGQGTNVSVALDNVSISLGGSSPLHYTSYPDDKLSPKYGYGCLPCRFSIGESLESSTASLPLDQDFLLNPRQPIYSFTKWSEPESCTKETTFEVRYFGSDACTGSNAPDGHFCTSGNLSQMNCPSTDSGAGGNIAGAFTTRLCAGSTFGTRNVSASWSPLVVDVAGEGIQISRTEDLAVDFDITGDGKKEIIDWPLNPGDNAFLIRPAKDGNVHSVKQLFGDNREKNGFKALKEYDSNEDGFVDRRDTRFRELRLWFDYNRDAISTFDEMATLEEKGVERIHLKYVRHLIKGIAGKTLESSYYNTHHKRYLNIIDAYFRAYPARFRKKREAKVKRQCIQKDKETKIKVIKNT